MVIRAVFVDVVNDFFRREIATNVPFHNQPMFHYISLAVAVWMFRDVASAVVPIGTISNYSTTSADSLFRFGIASVRTELSTATFHFGRVDSALVACCCYWFSPPMYQIAAVAAKTRNGFSSILRMERFSTLFTLKSYIMSFHTAIIAIN